MKDITEAIRKKFFPGVVFTTYEVSRMIKAPIGIRTILAHKLLERLVKEGKLYRYKRGEYYYKVTTVFGETEVDTHMYALKRLMRHKGKVIGYKCYATLINVMGLSTLVPRDQHITSNRYDDQSLDLTNIAVYKPVTKITTRNYKYLQILDLFNVWDELFIDCEDPFELIRYRIEKQSLSGAKLLKYAKKYYPSDILPKVFIVINGGNANNESAW